MESLKESYFFAQYKKEFGDKALLESSKLIYDLFLLNLTVEVQTFSPEYFDKLCIIKNQDSIYLYFLKCIH